MLNIFGALGRVASLLPNYLEGQRAAVQDNWRDLEKYNAVQAGQLQNLFDERVMPWRINRYGDLANISRWQSYADTLKGMEYLMSGGGRVMNAIRSNFSNPQMQQAMEQAFLRNLSGYNDPYSENNQFIQQLITNPWNMQQQLQQQQQQQQQQTQATNPNVTARVQTENPTAAGTQVPL